MSRRTRIFLGIFIVYLAAVAGVLYRLAADLDPRYRESAEESLVDTANLLATLLERGAYEGIIPTEELERTLRHLTQRPVYARIFGIEKTSVDLHVYVTDRDGFVLFDSHGRDVGLDYMAWRDVYLTLQGKYGARTTLADPRDPRSAVMYVGAAIRERGEGASRQTAEDIVGMVAVGKPIAAFSPFIANARTRLLAFGAVAAGSFALLVLFLVFWLVRPFGLLIDLWRAFRADAASGGSIRFGRRLIGAVRTAFAEARDTIAGRSYVEQYVQTLAHELKSPLAAIRGASELLREPMPEEVRARFAHNIEDQVARAQDLIDRLLELSALERRGALERVERIEVARLAEAVRDEVLPAATARSLAVIAAVEPELAVVGDAFLLQRALSNLVRNAIEFAPGGSSIEIRAHAASANVVLAVRDRGPGLPEYARNRVFEKFFSLPRPATGKRSTGLGLAFVREVAQLHGGSARIENHPDGGALASIVLPAGLRAPRAERRTGFLRTPAAGRAPCRARRRLPSGAFTGTSHGAHARFAHASSRFRARGTQCAAMGSRRRADWRRAQMSMVRLLAEGAGEAVRLVPLLFTLSGAPAQAQLPRAVPVQERPAHAPQALWPVAGSAAPTLVAEHLELMLAAGGSVARTTLVYRNDTGAPLAAHYTLPLAGAVSLRGVDDDPAELLDTHACDAIARATESPDDEAAAAQFLEAGEADPTTQHSGMVWLAPGDEVTLVAVRPVAVLARDARRRVVVRLPEPPEGQPAPRFSAEVAVDASEPIVALGSATHGGEVDGLGGSHARLYVPNGRVHEARFFSVDLQLAPVVRAESPRWGREDRLPIAAR